MPRLWPAVTRRGLLQGLLGGGALAALGGPWGRALASGGLQRVVFFYFPDGVIGQSQDGQPSQWHCTGGGSSFSLSPLLAPLEAWKSRLCVIHGLSLGGTDSGSHPGGAKKLLTATDHGNNESIDQYLSRTVGASMPWRHLYLGAQANTDGASGDKHIAYPVAGTTYAPEDDPRRAFSSLFSGFEPDAGGGGDTGAASPASARALRVLQALGDDVAALQARAGAGERQRLQVHLDSLSELQGRLGGGGGGGVATPTCEEPSVDMRGITDSDLTDPGGFPKVLAAQLDVATLALACGLTRVVTVQASHHTSELVMSRFPDTEMYDPSYDMRSHQASHYGASHDDSKREYRAFHQQRRWWVGQYAALLQRLADTPAPEGGALLDRTAVVLCTEVCDGNTHLHDNMPMLVAGGEAGGVRTGQLLDAGGRRNGDLFVALANAMGDGLSRFGDGSGGALPGLLG
jgi:hypothetical protein